MRTINFAALTHFRTIKNHSTMETEEKNNQEFNAANVEEPQQQENKEESVTPEAMPPQPKKRKKKRFLLFLIVTIIVGVATMILIKYIRDSNDADYITRCPYEYGEEPYESHLSYKKSKCNIINPVTKEVIVEDIEWSHHISDEDENPIVLFAKGGKRGFCNIATNEVIVKPTTYTKAWIFSEGLAAVEKDGFIGFVNTNGDVVIKPKFSYRGNYLAEFVFHNGHCVVADSSNRIGVIDKSGRWIVKPLYDHIELAKEYAIVYQDGEFKKQVDFSGNVVQDGIIDYVSNLYYTVNYSDLQTGKPDVAEAKINDFYEYHVGNYSGLINSKGEIITPPIYTDIAGITPTLFKAQLQDWNSVVLINQNGQVLSKVSK